MGAVRVFSACVPVAFAALVGAFAVDYSNGRDSIEFFQSVGYVLAVVAVGFSLQMKVEIDFISDESRKSSDEKVVSKAFSLFIYTLCFGLLFSKVIFGELVVFLALPLAYFLGQELARVAFSRHRR
ncbi:MAG: hypothetical protein ACK4E7_16680 [Permianibacter sp.]